MPDSAENIVESLLKHPDGEETREIAHAITDIVFNVRASGLFEGILEDIGSGDAANLRSLLNEFREKAENLTGISLPEPADDLYRQIILPLIRRRINNTA